MRLSLLALYLLTFILFFEISIPVPQNFGRSANSDKRMHPDPVPISKTCKYLSFE